MIEQYKKENKQLKTLRDELIANKRVNIKYNHKGNHTWSWNE